MFLLCVCLLSLLRTLHRQGPYERKPIAKRSLIVCPSSLVGNWEKEFKRWLGSQRINVWAVNSKNTVDKCNNNYPVIIISYEMAIRQEDALKRRRFDLMIVDEAHKIKNTKNQAYQVRSIIHLTTTN